MARSIPYRVLAFVTTIIVGVFVGGCGALFFGQEKLVFFPHSDIAMTPEEAGLKYEDLYLEPAPRARINAWYVPADAGRGTVIFCHGNGENIGDDVDYIEFYNGLGMNVLIVDYRGYGKSSGKPSEKATYEDAAVAWKYLTEVRGTRPDEIVLVGRSLGGGVVSHLAAQAKPAGMILESTFTSMPDMGAEIFPFFPIRLIARIHYDTKSRLGKVHCPVLVLHSREDKLVPYRHGERLFELANEPKRFVEIRGTHNEGPFERGDAYREAIDEFLTECMPKRP